MQTCCYAYSIHRYCLILRPLPTTTPVACVLSRKARFCAFQAPPFLSLLLLDTLLLDSSHELGRPGLRRDEQA